MQVITTHLNADFDCLGAMLAAKMLYPDAHLVFSGSQEKGVRRFFLANPELSALFTRLKDIDLHDISQLIIVDCQHASRIGAFAEVLGSVEVHIYDHHPDVSDRIDSSGGLVRSCGSTSALMQPLLCNSGCIPTPLQATAMLLGIYEDTGSLTYPVTTETDFTAATWFFVHGAKLEAVAEFLSRELGAAQVSLLNDLLHSLRRITAGGLDVGIATASLEYYLSDIASLAQMICDIEGVDAIFMVVGMGNRVYLIGRGRTIDLDVGEILRRFGGGGHATAGSATVKELTVIQVAARLEELLLRRVSPLAAVASIMTAPVKTVSADFTIVDARNALTRYNVNAMPVMRSETMIGVISRRIVEKALYHDLGDAPVIDYMHTEFFRVAPDTPILRVKEYLSGENHRFAPVFADEQLVGVVTRTDLLRFISSEESEVNRESESAGVRRNLTGMMKSSLAADTIAILHNLGETADGLDLKIYAVGGFVRDILLARENLDVDVTVEGDGILLAETFAARFGCRVKSHSKFGTATILFPDGRKVDVASTRLEYYDSPGVLPTVERSSLKMDLFRRDFTVNTLAISLCRAEFGKLTDFFGARKDLKEKTLRVLHNLSFVEDPTRVFRGIRFEQRLGFKMSSHTENLIRNSIKMNFLEKLGGRRLFAELVHIFEEREPQHAVARMAELGVIRFIHRSMEVTAETLALFAESAQVVTWYELLYFKEHFDKWIIYLLSLCSSLDQDQFVETCIRLETGAKFIEKYAESRTRGIKVLEQIRRSQGGRGRTLLPSEVCALLRTLPLEVLLHLMARADEGAKRQLSIYMTNLARVTTEIDGNYLKNIGLKPGPLFHLILEKVRDARIDGLVDCLEDELQMVNNLINVEKGGSNDSRGASGA